MGIVTPPILLSRIDKELLRLLADLVLASECPASKTKNAPMDSVVLSDVEADELATLLERYLEQRNARQALAFIDALAHPGEISSRRAKEIYLSMRVQKGRTRVLSTMRWQEFEERFWGGNAMSFEHFIKMERKLLDELPVHPRVRDLIIGSLQLAKPHIHELIAQNRKLPKGAEMMLLNEFRTKEPKRARRRLGLGPIYKDKLVAMATLVSDASVMFTTRDWSVTGTISAMSGALVQGLVK